MTTSPAPAVTDVDTLNALQAILFIAREPLPLADIAHLMQVPAELVGGICARLAARLGGSALQIVALPGPSYALSTRHEYAAAVERLLDNFPELAHD